jgi:hypothetical protein
MKTTFVLAAFFLLFVCGCEKEFIESDLTDKQITILAPADNDTVTTATPLFWWNELSGARNYRIQIVYPNFNAPQQLLYDTAVEGDRFYPALAPGNTYAWRIRPENGSSTGNWITRLITVDSTTSLSAQTVVVTSPANNGFATSNSSIAFAWNQIPAATFYRIEVINTLNSSSVLSTTTTATSLSYTFAQGNYQLSIRAENGNSFTSWSTRTFTIDQTAPTVPVLVSPANTFFYSSVPATLPFDWVNASDAVTDSLYVATDSTFATGIQAAVLLNASQSGYNWTGVQGTTTYFWHLRSIDAAGNRSNFSTTYKFIVN